MPLNPKQQEAVDYENGPLLIIAGAGSGKTKTLTSRLMRMLERGIAPERIIAITFTNKAAQEMHRRITDNLRPTTNDKKSVISHRSSVIDKLFIGTFHSFGARILRKEATHFDRTPAFTIFDDSDSLSVLKKIVKAIKVEGGDPPSPALLLKRVYATKNNLRDFADERDARARSALLRYEKMLAEQNAFDFGDLIEKPVRLFRAHPEVLATWQKKHTHLLIDEYQDVNPAQYALVTLLAEQHRNISVVGDDAQAIYGWRDANVDHFLRFPDDWPGVHIIKLEQNYRSTKSIISGASGVITQNTIQHQKELWTDNDTGSPIRVVGVRDAEEEAAWIAETIRGSARETVADAHTSTAILYRTNAQSRPIETALISANIPYRVFGGVKFYERKEIKDVLAALRFAANPKDLVSRERLDTALGKRLAHTVAEAIRTQADTATHLELIQLFLHEARYFALLRHEYPNAEERIENINELIVFASSFQTLQEFVERAALLQSTDTPGHTMTNNDNHDQKNAGHTHRHSHGEVTLMTIHMAKGLEFDRVFVAGVCEGILPHQMSYGTVSELEEERRLMYVAMTRARKELALSFYGLPSRFLHEIPPELTDFVSLSGNQDSLPEDDIVYVDE